MTEMPKEHCKTCCFWTRFTGFVYAGRCGGKRMNEVVNDTDWCDGWKGEEK